MSAADPAIRHIADTAAWMTFFRAQETDRPDALFRDPFARRLGGERAVQIAAAMPGTARNAWAFVTRTWLFDQFILQEVERGADLVVNLAAGLDARPYRLLLPSSLTWIEVDFPDLLAPKEQVLRDDKPACRLERTGLDLSDVTARREFFAEAGRRSRKTLVVTEGLLTYLTPEEVGALAADLARPASFQRWVVDIASPGLLRIMQRQMGKALDQAGAPFKFGPEEGPGFFTRFGWRPIDVRPMLETAAQLKRLSLVMRLLALLPQSNAEQGSRPWSAVCLLERI
jgi:methyltransferase (TIGR00027 family)